MATVIDMSQRFKALTADNKLNAGLAEIKAQKLARVGRSALTKRAVHAQAVRVAARGAL